jgi:hypothetical protein
MRACLLNHGARAKEEETAVSHTPGRAPVGPLVFARNTPASPPVLPGAPHRLILDHGRRGPVHDL